MTDLLTIQGQADVRGSRVLSQLISDGVCRSAWHADRALSTNTTALDQIHKGELLPTDCPRVFLADIQTAGRGRHGRQWISETDNLAVSMVVDAGEVASPSAKLLPISVGVAIAQAIEHQIAPMRVQLKWPNDIWLNNSKLAGILIERSSVAPELAVVGMGINIGSAPEQAVSLMSATGRPIDKLEVLEAIIIQVSDIMKSHDDHVINEFRSRCLLTRKRITFQYHGMDRSGECLGIDEHGRMNVQTEDGMTTIESGEVNLVRF
ncbi:biotin--[acetyl-CoA-carboxylase] ligase [Rubripirellula amarantea]|nr:biotin--[acetyl-CoA-carboxylase] ligase [Rubripirellula amarantea]